MGVPDVTMSLLILGLVIFLGVHLLPTLPSVRNGLVARYSEQRYKAMFSLASAAGLVLIVAGFAHAGPDARAALFAPKPAAIAIAPFAMVVSFILFAAANMKGHLRRSLGHPMLLGLLIWSLVHLLANGDVRGTVLFGALLAYALVDLASAISRHAVKPFVPQAKYDIMAIVGGTVVALLVMTFHRVLFGMPVVPFGI
jgi:uncharacterized membrane protein